MILAISTDKSFLDLCSNVANDYGYIFASADYESSLDKALRLKPDVAVVHSFKGTEALAKECVSLFALQSRETKILTAIEKDPDAPSRYLDIEGAHRQIVLPSTKDDLALFISRLSPAFKTVNSLSFGNGRKALTLLGERLRLSKTDYAILRLTVKSYPYPLDEKRLQVLYPKMTKNCLAVHIGTINKAAEGITERRLIIFKNGYKLNEFM